MDPFKGTIRDCYQRYRLSDHQSTNVSLKNKTLKIEYDEQGNEIPLYFEGHMNWSFQNCTFDGQFYFGEEGARLEGDTRGTEGNDVPFPPYGSNGLVFDNCTFNNKLFFKKNCVIVFRSCRFELSAEEQEGGVTPLLLEDGCRVEFDDCYINRNIDMKDYTDAVMRNSEFDASKGGGTNISYFVKAEGHCKLQLDDVEVGIPENYMIHMDEDSHAVVSATEADEIDYISKYNHVFWASNYSSFKVYSLMNIKTTDGGCAMFLDTSSKGEIRKIGEFIKGCTAGIKADNGSEAFVYDVGALAPNGGGIEGRDSCALFADNGSLVRARDIYQNEAFMKSERGDAIYSGNGSSIFIYNAYDIIGQQGSAFRIENANMEVDTFNDALGLQTDGLTATGSGTIVVKNGNSLQGQGASGITATGGPDVFVKNMVDGEFAVYGVEDGITATGAKIHVEDCTTVHGITNGVNASGSCRVRISGVPEILGDDEIGLLLNSSSFDVRDISTQIFGKLVGCSMTSSRGLMMDITLILGEDEAGCIINGLAGPSEFARIQKIECEKEGALKLYGDLSQTRFVDINEVHSMEGDALSLIQSGGITHWRTINKIYSDEKIGAKIVVSSNAQVEFEEVEETYSLQDIGMDLTVSGTALFRGYDGGKIYSEQKTGLKATTSDQARVGFNTFDEIYSQQEKAVQVNVTGQSTLDFYKVDEIYSQQDNVFDGTVDSRLTVMKSTKIYSQQGQIVNILGGGEKHSSVVFEEIEEMTTQQSPGEAIGINGPFTIELEDIGKIEAQQVSGAVVRLASDSPKYGIIKMLDCKEITGQQADNIVEVSSALKADLVGVKESCNWTGETINKSVLRIESTSAYVSNMAELSCSGGEGHGIHISDSGSKGNEVKLYDIAKIKCKKHGIFCDDVQGHVKLIDVAEIDASEGEDGIKFTGTGHLHIYGESSKMAIKAKDADKYALDMTGSELCTLRARHINIAADKGKINLQKCDFDIYSSILSGGDITITEATGVWKDITIIGDKDITVDDKSTLDIRIATIDDNNGTATLDGVIRLDNVIMTKKLAGTNDKGALSVNKCIFNAVDTGSSVICNDVTAQADFGFNNPMFINKGRFEGVFNINDRTAVFLNEVEILNDGIFIQGPETALFANYLVTGGAIASPDLCAGFFNSLKIDSTEGYLDFDQASGVIVNRGEIGDYLAISAYSGLIANAVWVKGDLMPDKPESPYGGSGLLLNRVFYDEDGTFRLDPGTGVIAPWIKGGDIEFLPSRNNDFDPYFEYVGFNGSWFNGIKGMVSGFSHFKGDVTMDKGSGLIQAANTSEGSVTINEGAAVIDIQGLHYFGAAGNGAGLSLGTDTIMDVGGSSALRSYFAIEAFESEHGTKYDSLIFGTTYTRGWFGKGSFKYDIEILTDSAGTIKRFPSNEHWDV